MLSTAHNHDYYGVIHLELKRFLYLLLENPMAYHELGTEFCGRVASRLTYGWPSAGTFLASNAFNFIGHISPGGSITNLMPFLGKLPEALNPSIRDVRQRRELEAANWTEYFNRVKNDLRTTNRADLPTSWARTYLERKEINSGLPDIEASDSPTSFGFADDDKEALYALGMLGTVAIFTITGPYFTFMLAMALHPEWQRKAQEEVDRVLDGRPATLQDSPNLPMVRAIIKECIRWRPPVPLGMSAVLVHALRTANIRQVSRVSWNKTISTMAILSPKAQSCMLSSCMPFPHPFTSEHH